MTQTTVSLSDTIETEEVVSLYRANAWSSAENPVQLLAAPRNSHALVTARIEGKLVGNGNAISDGYLVVYFRTCWFTRHNTAKASAKK